MLAALGFATSSLGALTISSGGTAGFSVALNGTDQTATYTLPFTVDANGPGTNNGWNVSASATQFVNGTYTFPADAQSVVGVAAPTTCTGRGCAVPVPSGNVSYPVTLPNTGGSSIYSAASRSGLGTNTLTATVAVAAPANIYTGTYTSTVTLQVASGP